MGRLAHRVFRVGSFAETDRRPVAGRRLGSDPVALMRTLELSSGGRLAGLIWNPSESARLAEPIRARVRAQQVFAIARLTPPLMMANVTNALALVIVLELSGQSSLANSLWAAIAICAALFMLWRWFANRDRAFPETVSRGTIRRLIRNAGALGVLWAIPGLMFLPETSGSAQSFLIALSAGMIAGGAMALYPIPAAAIAYTGAIALGGLVGFATTGDPTLIGFAAITAAFFYVVSRTVTRHAEVFVAEFVGRRELGEKNALIERLLAAERAAADEERARSGHRLAHAQKMEAIGQLTGGIAHDFNNLLAAIQGHAELIELDGRTDKTLTRPILNASARASELVQRLLSVGRRQVLRPADLELENLIASMAALLGRTLGAQIAVRTRIERDLWPVHADSSQLEATILNLALNARDAMPTGGELLISCRNARVADTPALGRLGEGDGEFVCISVQDTGVGMTPEVCERAFEPFFTTHRFGERSGLGLATAYGFARQSGGQLIIDSKPSEGTTITMYLPRGVTSTGTGPKTARKPVLGDRSAVPSGNGERILVVEDDPEVLRVTSGMLRGLGYLVDDAGDAAEALSKLGAGTMPDMILCDVVLPGGISGPQLARRLPADARNVPVALMSGYPGDAGGRADPVAACTGAALLRKPFRRSDLAELVAGVLAAS